MRTNRFTRMPDRSESSDAKPNRGSPYDYDRCGCGTALEVTTNRHGRLVEIERATGRVHRRGKLCVADLTIGKRRA